MAFDLERLAVVRGQIAQGPCRTLLDGIGLAGEATAAHVHQQVVLALQTEGLQRGLHGRQIDGVVVEVVVAGASVDGDAAAAGHHPDPGDRRLATTRAPVDDAVGGAGHRAAAAGSRARGWGFWAAWGWSAPL